MDTTGEQQLKRAKLVVSLQSMNMIYSQMHTRILARNLRGVWLLKVIKIAKAGKGYILFSEGTLEA